MISMINILPVEEEYYGNFALEIQNDVHFSLQNQFNKSQIL